MRRVAVLMSTGTASRKITLGFEDEFPSQDLQASMVPIVVLYYLSWVLPATCGVPCLSVASSHQCIEGQTISLQPTERLQALSFFFWNMTACCLPQMSTYKLSLLCFFPDLNPSCKSPWSVGRHAFRSQSGCSLFWLVIVTRKFAIYRTSGSVCPLSGFVNTAE